MPAGVLPMSARPPDAPSPLPSPQILLRADAAATVAVLGEALSGWDAVETDLRAAAGRPTQELDSVLVASQVCVAGGAGQGSGGWGGQMGMRDGIIWMQYRIRMQFVQGGIVQPFFEVMRRERPF